MARVADISGSYLSKKQRQNLVRDLFLVTTHEPDKAKLLEHLFLTLNTYSGCHHVNIYRTELGSLVWAAGTEPAAPISQADFDYLQTHCHTNPPQAKACHFLILSRKNEPHLDPYQLQADEKRFATSCDQVLWLFLLGTQRDVLAAAVLHQWGATPSLADMPELAERLQDMDTIASTYAMALSANRSAEAIIESLLLNKRDLDEKTGREQVALTHRVLEHQLLYDAANSFARTQSIESMVDQLITDLHKMMKVDACGVLILKTEPQETSQLHIRLYSPKSEGWVSSLEKHTRATIRAFVPKSQTAIKNLRVTPVSQFAPETMDSDGILRSFYSVPIGFRGHVLGLVTICSMTANAFGRHEATFIHTITHLLSAHLGHIKQVTPVGKSVLAEMVNSMTEGVILLDKDIQIDLINPAALKMLGLGTVGPTSNALILNALERHRVLDLIYQVIYSGKAVLEQDIISTVTILSANVTPVLDDTQTRTGTVVVLRNTTDLHRINRINTQRLEVISKVNHIVGSISDLDKLLELLLKFIIDIAQAKMGSVQLVVGKRLVTRSHFNFPDKIRGTFRLKTGETIAEYVRKTRQLCHITAYHKNPSVMSAPKLVLESYICMPILAGNRLLGIFNIVRPLADTSSALTNDDIETLSTITALSGTAIHNAILYQETLKKQKMDQEMQLALEIQGRLLSQTLPDVEGFSVGLTWVPARSIGGDYYDFIEIDTDHVGFLIADIVGKGIPAAMLMVMVKTLFRTNAGHIVCPDKALTQMNIVFAAEPLIEKYVPLFYGVLCRSTKTLVYVNAGHEPALLFRNNVLTQLDTPGLPLGAFPDTVYEAQELQFEEGDFLTLYTDGVLEARNPEIEEFGLERLQSQILRFSKYPAPIIADGLYGSLEQFMQSPQPFDDITMIILKCSQNPGDFSTPLYTRELKVNSARNQIPIVRKEVEDIASRVGFGSSEIFDIKLAVNEAHSNVCEHAYQRADKGVILFTFLVYSDRLTIIVRDYGQGISVPLKGESELDELEGSGLGVLLIEKLMDDVRYNRSVTSGTELWLTKYLPTAKSIDIPS